MATADMLNRLARLEVDSIAPAQELVVIHEVGRTDADLVGLSGPLEGFLRRANESGTDYADRARQHVADTMRCAGPLILFARYLDDLE
jgi:hypothetical protein